MTIETDIVTPSMRRFLEEAVDSFEKLMIVQSLWSAKDVPWSADDLAAKVGIPWDQLLPALAALAGRGLVVSDSKPGQYRAPATSPDVEIVEAVLAVYERDPYAVMRVINEVAIARIRGLAARTFADAFVVQRNKKPEPGDG